MIDLSLVKLMHRHDDGWAALEPVDDESGGRHDPAQLDPERDVRSWVRRYRCAECAEEFAVGTGDVEVDRSR